MIEWVEQIIGVVIIVIAVAFCVGGIALMGALVCVAAQDSHDDINWALENAKNAFKYVQETREEMNKLHEEMAVAEQKLAFIFEKNGLRGNDKHDG